MNITTNKTRKSVVARRHMASTTTTSTHSTVKKKQHKLISNKPKVVIGAPKKKVAPKTVEKEFRLFDFQAFDDRINVGETDDRFITTFMIRMFGINTDGETCVITVDDYKPFFYIQVPNSFTRERVDALFHEIRDDRAYPKYKKKEFVSAELETHKRLYQFTGDLSYKFVKLTFSTVGALRCVKNILMGITYDKENTKSEKELKKYTIYPIYESGIPPLLRYFHIFNISPSGWIRLNHNETLPVQHGKLSNCTYEYVCTVNQVHPLPEKETPVPYKIASFDIEASSSHGDFPLPVKDYKRLASQIIDLLLAKQQKQQINSAAINMLLKKAIKTAFGFESLDNIDLVYPKYPKTKEQIVSACKFILETKIADETVQKQNSELSKAVEFFEKRKEESGGDGGGGDGTEGGDGDCGGDGNEKPHMGSGYAEEIGGGGRTTKSTGKQSKLVYSKEDRVKTIGEYLVESVHTREERIQTLNTLFTNLIELQKLPPLKGDEITFIGTTFIRNGEPEPYKNHCIVVDTCTTVDGVEIQSVPDEKQCILNWTDLIQNEDPDIIIGYNIFGFDYQFMFQRAKELDIVEEFCKLSRIEDEICAKQNYKTGLYQLDHTQNRLASGDYDLHYPCISGRLQIDLLFYFRRDYNLSSYKLDDVAGTMIRDDIKGIEPIESSGNSLLYSKNLAGLHVGDFIHLEITSFTTDYYAGGRKFKVLEIAKGVTVEESSASAEYVSPGQYNVITIEGHHPTLNPKKQNVKWGMAKDDVSPQDIFRLSKESAASRAIVAKYCIQDCNLVHHLMKKVDVLTGYNEMSRICNVPISFLVFRGQGIKLTSYVAKVCREKGTLMPDLKKVENDDGYEGAIVLPPKCEMYGENPVACVDYSSLYPSIAKGWNLSPNSKVWTKTFDLNGRLVKVNDKPVLSEAQRDKMLLAAAQYDNLDGYKYINVTFDNFEQHRKVNKEGKFLKMEKVKSGYKEVRWAKFPHGQEGIIPCIIGDLLKARKETRKKAESEPDPFLANVLDKRQLGYKVTANSLYGQMGSSVSTFFEKDVAASITSIGRQMITYAKRMVEEIYGNSVYELKSGNSVRLVRTKSQYVYGDTDSVFFTFNLEDPETGAPIRGKDALEITIEIAQEAAELCSLFLPPPMKLAYEKTLMSFILLSKKRYVGMLYEFNPNKGKLKFMGLPLKRRDSCDYLKDVYGGILTILMKEPDNVQKAIEFLNDSLQSLVDGSVSIDKLALTKSLRSNYKNPMQIAHKVLAERVGEREPGNKPKPGDRIKYAFIENKGQKLLGDRVETLDFIAKNKIPLDYHYYITNQLMNPLLQLFSLGLDKVYKYKKMKQKQIIELHSILDQMYQDCDGLIEPYMKKREKYCSAEVKRLLFEPFLVKIYNNQHGIRTLKQFWG
jgi:DNA polymerase elongation subunit (family B)